MNEQDSWVKLLSAAPSPSDSAGDNRHWLLALPLALVLLFLAYQEWLAARPLPSAAPLVAADRPSLQPPPVSSARANADETVYYLVGSPEAAASMASLFQLLVASPPSLPSTYVFRSVTGEAEESQVRQTIDAANRQVEAYGEPGFRMVDLRPWISAHPAMGEVTYVEDRRPLVSSLAAAQQAGRISVVRAFYDAEIRGDIEGGAARHFLRGHA